MFDKIKILIMDVDGTLTDGKIYIGENGEIMKAFNVKDGIAIINLIKNNIIPVFLTARQSKIVEYRAKELGVTEVFQGISDKTKILNDLCEKYGITYENIAYIGDDVQDLSAIELVGFSFAPNDASEIIRQKVDVVLNKKCGEGALREAVEYIFYYAKISDGHVVNASLHK